MKKSLLLLIFGAVLAHTASAQTFNHFLARVNSAPDSLRGAIVDSFLAAVPAVLYIDADTVVHFLYRGTGSTITIPGDANNWNSNAWAMTRISGTNLFYHTRLLEADARLDYKFVINGSSWIIDPLNPHTVNGGFGPNSELRMPAWVAPPEIVLYPEIPHGTLQDTSFFSTNMGNARTIRIYLPPDYANSADHYPVVLFHDGLEYISLAQANRVLDYLIAHRRIQPVIGIFVPPVARTEEYAGALQDEFSAFINQELLPWVDGRFRTIAAPASRATLGASNGGNIALHLAVTHPEVFAFVAAHSSNVQSHISTALQSGPLLDLRFYLDLGTYDIPVLIPLVRNLRTILEQRGYENRYVEFHEGHSWGNWRAHIDNALEMFVPGDSATAVEVREIPRSPLLLENYPNPFNAATTIRFTIPAASRVSIDLFDLNGRHIDTLYADNVAAGSHEFRFDAAALPSGLYFCRLRTGTGSLVHKLVVMK